MPVTLLLIVAVIGGVIATSPELVTQFTLAPDDEVVFDATDQQGSGLGVGADGALRSILPDRGVVFSRELWSREGVRATTPVAVGRRVYIIDLGGTVVGVDAGSGDTVWEADSVRTARAGTVLSADSDVVVVGDRLSGVDVFDANTAAPLWSSAAGPLTAPAIHDGAVVVMTTRRDGSGTPEAVVVAYDARDGTQRFERVVGLSGGSHAPVVAADVVVVCLADGAVVGLDLADGRERFRYAVAGAASCTVDPDTGYVVVGSLTGDLAVVDGSDGEEIWTTSIPGAIAAPPTVARGAVYAAVGFETFAYDLLTGDPMWVAAGEGRATRAPSANDGAVFVAASDSTLSATYLHTGAVRWVYAAPSPVASGIAVVGDSVIVALANGRLVSVGVYNLEPTEVP